MPDEKESFFIRATNSTMLFLGSTTRSITDGLSFILPFMKTRNARSEEYSKTADEVSSGAREHLEPEYKEGLLRTAVLKKMPGQRPVDIRSFMSGIEFKNNLERAEAEAYVLDIDSQTRYLNSEVLGKIKKLSWPAATGILEKLLTVKKDPEEIIGILHALSGLNTGGTIRKDIFKDFLEGQHPFVRLAALDALSRYKDEDSYSILSSSFSDKDARVRKQVLYLMYWRYEDECQPVVLAGLHDVDAGIRKTAARICGILKLYSSITNLIALLEDPDKEVQRYCAESLRKITREGIDFNPEGSEAGKRDSIEKWRMWWFNNKDVFGTGAGKGAS